MPRPAIRISLAPTDRRHLNDILRSGTQPVRVVLRALALLHLGEDSTVPNTARAVRQLTPKAVRSIAHRYKDGGLARALYEKARPGAVPLLRPAEEQHILTMVCGDPPAGATRWTVRLAAAEAVRRKLARRAGRETVRLLLKKHGLTFAEQARIEQQAA